MLDDPDAEEARQRAREAAEAAAEAAAAAGAAPWDPNWEPGELDVRLVLLGAPDTPGLAAQPPSWARRGRATHLVLCLLLVWGCPGRAAAQLGQAQLDDQLHLACRIARCLSGAALAWFWMDSADERGADSRREFCIAGPCRPWVWHALSASPGCTPRTADPAARGAPGRRRKVSWRTAAGRLLQAERDLNRSQREAIAKAITRTFTLWQARRPHSWHPANWGHALGGRRGQAARAQRWRQDTGSCAVSLGAPGGSTILPHRRARACPSRRGVGPGACGAAARVRVPAAGATDRAAEAHCMRVGPRLRRRAAGWAAPTRACARAGPAGHRKDEDAARAAARAGNRGRRAPRRARGPHPGLRRHQCRHGQPGGGPAAARRARHPPRPALQGAGDSLEFECLQSDLVYPPVSLPSKQRGRAAGLSAACSATATCAQRVTCSVFPLRLVHLTHDVICGQAASFHSGAHWSSEELACQTAGDAGWAQHAAWLGLHKAAQLCTGSRLLRRRPNAELPRRAQIRESVREAAALEFQSYNTLSGKVVRARLAYVLGSSSSLQA